MRRLKSLSRPNKPRFVPTFTDLGRFQRISTTAVRWNRGYPQLIFNLPSINTECISMLCTVLSIYLCSGFAYTVRNRPAENPNTRYPTALISRFKFQFGQAESCKTVRPILWDSEDLDLLIDGMQHGWSRKLGLPDCRNRFSKHVS